MVLFSDLNHFFDYYHSVMCRFILGFACGHLMNYPYRLIVLDAGATLAGCIYKYFFFDRCLTGLCLFLLSRFLKCLNELRRLSWNSLFAALLFGCLLLRRILIVYHLIMFLVGLREIHLIS